MKRFAILLFTFALLAAACSSAPSESADQTPSSVATQPDATTAPDPGDTGSGSGGGTDTTTQTPDGPVAPNFTLALASGEDFVLADAAKPVYMVFWAEW